MKQLATLTAKYMCSLNHGVCACVCVMCHVCSNVSCVRICRVCVNVLCAHVYTNVSCVLMCCVYECVVCANVSCVLMCRVCACVCANVSCLQIICCAGPVLSRGSHYCVPHTQTQQEDKSGELPTLLRENREVCKLCSFCWLLEKYYNYDVS